MCVIKSAMGTDYTSLLTAFYLHLGPFLTQHIIRQIELRLDEPQHITPQLCTPVEQPGVAIAP